MPTAALLFFVDDSPKAPEHFGYSDELFLRKQGQCAMTACKELRQDAALPLGQVLGKQTNDRFRLIKHLALLSNSTANNNCHYGVFLGFLPCCNVISVGAQYFISF